jgi:uncharacterized protein HemY
MYKQKADSHLSKGLVLRRCCAHFRQVRNARIKALQREGRLADIEPILQEVLAERQDTLGDDHPDTLKSISTLGRLLQVQGKLGEARPLFERALAGRRRALGDAHPYTLNSVNDLGEEPKERAAC